MTADIAQTVATTRPKTRLFRYASLVSPTSELANTATQQALLSLECALRFVAHRQGGRLHAEAGAQGFNAMAGAERVLLSG
jgi:hypothetical protein